MDKSSPNNFSVGCPTKQLRTSQLILHPLWSGSLSTNSCRENKKNYLTTTVFSRLSHCNSICQKTLCEN